MHRCVGPELFNEQVGVNAAETKGADAGRRAWPGFSGSQGADCVCT